MRKLVCVFVCVFLLFECINSLANTSVKGKRLTAEIYRENECLCVSGQLVYPEEKRISLIFKDASKNIIYVNQAKSAPDGKFLFRFTPQTAMNDNEVYTAIIGCSGTTYSEKLEFEYSDIKNILEQEQEQGEADRIIYKDSECINLNLILTMRNYVPTISGSISAQPGCYANISLEDVDDAYTTIVGWYSDKPEPTAISYTFPSITKSQRYNFRITGSGGLDMSVRVDASILISALTHNMSLGDGAYIDLNIKSSDIEFLNITRRYTDYHSNSFVFPSVLPNGTYEVNATFVNTYTEDDINNVHKSTNENLYNALISKYPHLDEENRGVIYSDKITGTNGILDLSNCNVESLIGMCNSKITAIMLDNNNITSLRPLSFIKTLSYISARNNKINNVSNFGDNIVHINLDNNLLTDLLGLKDAKKSTVSFRM